MDLKLYKSTAEELEYPTFTADVMQCAPLSGVPATRLECIAGKVAKFMLTPIGSDLLDPEYGAYLPTYTQIAKSAIPQLYIDIQEDIQRCISYIARTEKDLGETTERMESIRLVDLAYAPGGMHGVLLVRIEIKTTFTNYAMVDLDPTA